MLIPQVLLPSNWVPFANCHHFLLIALRALLLTFSSEKSLSLCEVTSFRGYSLTLGILLCNYTCQMPQAGKTFELLKVLGDGRKDIVWFFFLFQFSFNLQGAPFPLSRHLLSSRVKSPVPVLQTADGEDNYPGRNLPVNRLCPHRPDCNCFSSVLRKSHGDIERTHVVGRHTCAYLGLREDLAQYLELYVVTCLFWHNGRLHPIAHSLAL